MRSFHVSPRRCVSVTFEAGSQWLILSSGGCLAHSERRAGRTGGELLLQDSPTRGHLDWSTCKNTVARHCLHPKHFCLLISSISSFDSRVANTLWIVRTFARIWISLIGPCYAIVQSCSLAGRRREGGWVKVGRVGRGRCQVSGGELNRAASRARLSLVGEGKSFFTGGTTSISAAKRGLFH